MTVWFGIPVAIKMGPISLGPSQRLTIFDDLDEVDGFCKNSAPLMFQTHIFVATFIGHILCLYSVCYILCTMYAIYYIPYQYTMWHVLYAIYIDTMYLMLFTVLYTLYYILYMLNNTLYSILYYILHLISTRWMDVICCTSTGNSLRFQAPQPVLEVSPRGLEMDVGHRWYCGFLVNEQHFSNCYDYDLEGHFLYQLIRLISRSLFINNASPES